MEILEKRISSDSNYFIYKVWKRFRFDDSKIDHLGKFMKKNNINWKYSVEYVTQNISGRSFLVPVLDCNKEIYDWVLDLDVPRINDGKYFNTLDKFKRSQLSFVLEVFIPIYVSPSNLKEIEKILKVIGDFFPVIDHDSDDYEYGSIQHKIEEIKKKKAEKDEKDNKDNSSVMTGSIVIQERIKELKRLKELRDKKNSGDLKDSSLFNN